jgi:hypothetical protein
MGANQASLSGVATRAKVLGVGSAMNDQACPISSRAFLHYPTQERRLPTSLNHLISGDQTAGTFDGFPTGKLTKEGITQFHLTHDSSICHEFTEAQLRMDFQPREPGSQGWILYHISEKSSDASGRYGN